MSPLRRKALVVAAAALPVLAGGWALQARPMRDGARLFDQVLSLVADRFVDTVDTAALYEKAARGLIQQLNDPYSELFAPKQAERFSQTSTGRYGGIGMQIEKQQDNIVVVRVFPNTPAERAGVVEGDRIVGVDTASTRDWSSQQVSDAILGPPGSRVRVRFARPGVGQPIEHTLTRAVIHIPAVPYTLMLDGRIGYIPLQSFNETASRELTDAIERLTKQGAKSLVLDLRNDPGGILDQALSISDYFLRPGQEIASVRPRNGKQQQFVAQGREHIPDIPLVVMVNGYSASASEIVAGALQDHDRALVIGTTTYGKGLVQSVFPLDGGYALKLTTAKWYTPSGRSITKDRATVDRGVATLGAQRDPQRDSADDQAPDSLEKESVKKNRPVFRSAGGRVVYGGGGITPDIIVSEDTISTAEQALARAIAPKAAIARAAMYDIALEQKSRATRSLAARPEWREDFYRRLAAAGFEVDRKLYDAGAPLVDRWIAERVVRTAFGDSTYARLTIPEDPQLTRALELLRKGQTQRDLFALAQQYTQASVRRAP